MIKKVNKLLVIVIIAVASIIEVGYIKVKTIISKQAAVNNLWKAQ